MLKFVFPLIAGIALSVPAIAQDPYHIRGGDRVYDIRTGSSDGGVVLSDPSGGGLEADRQALIAAGCLRPDEADLSRHDCCVNRDGTPVHRLPETISDGPKVTPLFAAMEPIALASIEVELVRVILACSVGIS
jgi:hypothetical protein